jgi:acyl-CoA synthetase (AMP-forming)/AMP-acid ligase II
MNLADALSHHVRARPDRAAVIHGERIIRYRDLDALVRRWAAHLASLGIAAGEVLGIALKDSPEHLLALYASARLGSVSLPMDWRWLDAEKAAVAARFGARRVLVEPDAAPVPGQDCVVVDRHFHAAVAAAPADQAFPTGAQCGQMPLLLSLSSGTTGRPKGPMITHYQFLRRFWTHWIDLGLNARETYLSATPLYFGGGRTFCMSELFSGGTVVLFPPPYTPQALAAEIAARRATSLFLVPTQLRRMLDLSAKEAAPLRSLRLLLASGSPLHASERREIRERLCPNFHEYYASTEGGGVSLLRPEDMDAHGESVGRPVFGVEVAILDDAGQGVPHGEVGRLAYRGPGVATGFYQDSDPEAFHDGWFLPGDLAAVDADGFVYLKGRRKDMIIRGGINIYPVEIEAVLLSHPGVAEAAVVGWPSRERGEEVAAFVVLREPVRPDELRALCARQLAPYKVPREVFVVPEMPKSGMGKIVKAELAASLEPL